MLKTLFPESTVIIGIRLKFLCGHVLNFIILHLCGAYKITIQRFDDKFLANKKTACKDLKSLQTA